MNTTTISLLFIFTVFMLLNTSNITCESINPYYNTTCNSKSLSECNNGQFVCLNGVCSSCEKSEQCSGYPFMICKNSTISVLNDQSGEPETIAVGQCKQRSLIPPTWRDVAISVFCFIGGGLAASAGIGGGGVYVPALLLIGGYSAQVAVPISTVIIFGCAIANWSMLAPQKHPNASNRPLINYSAALILQPIILCGSSLGVLLNTIIPNWLLVLLLVSLLTFTIYKTIKKGLDLRKKEKQAEISTPVVPLETSPDSVDELEQTTNDVELQEDDSQAVIHSGEEVKQEDLEEVNLKEQQEDEQEASVDMPTTDRIPIFDLEGKQYPWQVLALLVVPWLVVLVISLLNGSKKAPSLVGIKQCSGLYWLLLFIQIPILFGYSFLIGFFYYRNHQKKVQNNYKFEEGDIHWTKKNVLVIPSLFLTAGLVAGLLGIGGGMVTGPLLLNLGAPPQVSIATSSFMIFFTSSSTAAQFFVIGSVPYDYGLWYGILGFFSGLVGQFIVGKMLKRYNKASYVVFFVVVVILLSCISMIGTGIYRTITDIQRLGIKSLNFKSFC